MKTIVITGATSGIGRAAAQEMAARGWQVVGIGRSQEKCDAAVADISAKCPGSRPVYFTGDLSLQREVNRLADEVIAYLDKNHAGRLDVLLNNAGCVKDWYIATEDGYETQFAVNHLAGFLLAHRLLGALMKAECGRVLTVSSGSHYKTLVRWNDIMHKRGYNCLLVYKQSKLCNVLFTHEFNRRYKDTPVRAYAVDPGLVNTDIGKKGTGGFISWFWGIRSKYGTPASEPAKTISYLCQQGKDFSPKWAYFYNSLEKEPSKPSRDCVGMKRLWELSEQLCGIQEGEVK